jgi:hypothetical protein
LVLGLALVVSASAQTAGVFGIPAVPEMPPIRSVDLATAAAEDLPRPLRHWIRGQTSDGLMVLVRSPDGRRVLPVTMTRMLVERTGLWTFWCTAPGMGDRFYFEWDANAGQTMADLRRRSCELWVEYSTTSSLAGERVSSIRPPRGEGALMTCSYSSEGREVLADFVHLEGEECRSLLLPSQVFPLDFRALAAPTVP